MAGEVVPVAVAIIVATASAVKVIMEITTAIMQRNHIVILHGIIGGRYGRQ